MSADDAPPPPHRVVLAPYDPQWPARAALEAGRLRRALGANLIEVEHFGSTSVRGLAAKPVLDLMPLVVDLEALDRERAKIEALGYTWFGEFGIVGRRFCTLTSPDGERLAHLHAYRVGSAEIARHLVFRDYLRAHPDIAQAYEREKRRAAGLHPDDSLAYNDEKDAWIALHESRALAWRAERREG